MKYREDISICGSIAQMPSNATPSSGLQSTGIEVQPRGYPIPQILQPTSLAERWADYVFRGCKSDKDLKTIDIWARQVAVSYTSLCETCRLIGIQPRQARDFTRILRAITRSSFDSLQIASLLDVSDRRTLESILTNAGFPQHMRYPQPISILAFIDNQRFISRANVGIRIIRDCIVRTENILLKPA
jgi:hypothetical protein